MAEVPRGVAPGPPPDCLRPDSRSKPIVRRPIERRTRFLGCRVDRAPRISSRRIHDCSSSGQEQCELGNLASSVLTTASLFLGLLTIC